MADDLGVLVDVHVYIAEEHSHMEKDCGYILEGLISYVEGAWLDATMFAK